MIATRAWRPIVPASALDASQQGGAPAPPEQLTAGSMIRAFSLCLGHTLLALVLLLVLPLLTGTSLASVCSAAAHFLLFYFLPGFAVLVRTSWFLGSPALLVIWSLALGLTIQPLWLTPIWMAGALSLSWLVPLVALGSVFQRCAGHCLQVETTAWHGLKPLVQTIGLGVGAGISAWLGVIFAFSGPQLNIHFLYQAVVARTAEGGWPPINIMTEGASVSYNYALHLGMLLAVHLWPLDLMETAARVFPILFLELAILTSIAFARTVLGLRWGYAVLAMMSTFWVVGYGPVNAGVFGSAIPTASTLVTSSLGAFVILFVALRFLAEKPATGVLRDGSIAFLLGFSLTGMRAPLGAVLLCVTGALVLLPLWKERRLDRSSIALLIGTFFGILLAVGIFFTPLSNVGFIKIGHTFTWLANGQAYPLIEMLKGLGVLPAVAGAIGFLVMAVMQAEFLAPAFIYACARMTRGFTLAQFVLVAASFAGVSGTMLTEAPGGSHFSLMHAANLSMSLLGGLGLDRAISVIREQGAVRHEFGAYAAVIGVMLVIPFSAYDLWHQINGKELFAKPLYYSTPEFTSLFRRLDKNDRVLLFMDHEDKPRETEIALEYAARTGVHLVGTSYLLREYADWNKHVEPILRRRLEFMAQAQDNVDKGELHTDDLRNLVSTLLTPIDQVAVIAPSRTKVVGNATAIREIARADRYMLYRFLP
jgi:hypothetical protein